jgi:hypothetical protein
LANVPRLGDKSLDGRDLTPLLTNQNGLWPNRMIFSTWGPNVSVRTQEHRLDNTGALFDMIADPDQTRDIAAEKPEVAKQLREAVASWRAELGLEKPVTKGKGGKSGKGNAVDERPIPVGYREFPRTPLPARDGDPLGTVKRSSGAPNCSYFVNWTTKDDRMIWKLDVHTAGDYEVEILYTCPEGDEGSTVELSFLKDRLTSKVSPAWNPPLYTNQDTIPRPAAESTMKEFRTLNAGTLHLEKGVGELTLRALEIPGKSVMNVRQVNLILK